MLRITEAVAVEGKCDAVKLREFLDTLIIPTNGFRIYRDRSTVALLRRLAEERGLVILTDSDAAGFQIRNYIASCISPKLLKHAYIPPVTGKERRKPLPSKEGLLGVEGMNSQVIVRALLCAGVTPAGKQPLPHLRFMNTTRLYEDGLSGQQNSRKKRKAVCAALGLPDYLSCARLAEVLNAAFREEEYLAALSVSERS